MNHLEILEYFAHLVALHPADEVPVQGTGQRRDLRLGLLNFAFSKYELACFKRFPHRLHGECFGNCDQFDGIRFSPGPQTGVADLAENKR